LILINQDGIGGAHNAEIKFFLEGYTKSLVEHGGAFFVGEEEDFRNGGVFCGEGIEVGVGDFDDVGVEVLGCCFLEGLDGVVLLG
jgi:hypothetical protein